MKKLAIIFSLLAVCGFMLCVCGDDNGNGGPHCEDPPATCDPDCDYMAGEVCCGTTCKTAVACDPPTCEAGVSICNPCDGTCVTIPETCEPVCPAGQYCDDNLVCQDNPVCDPVCTGEQICVP